MDNIASFRVNFVGQQVSVSLCFMPQYSAVSRQYDIHFEQLLLNYYGLIQIEAHFLLIIKIVSLDPIFYYKTAMLLAH